jgi:hypothetical protein
MSLFLSMVHLLVLVCFKLNQRPLGAGLEISQKPYLNLG